MTKTSSNKNKIGILPPPRVGITFLLKLFSIAFSGYPTIFIFDKKGNANHNKTGFSTDDEIQQRNSIELLLDKNL